MEPNKSAELTDPTPKPTAEELPQDAYDVACDNARRQAFEEAAEALKHESGEWAREASMQSDDAQAVKECMTRSKECHRLIGIIRALVKEQDK